MSDLFKPVCSAALAGLLLASAATAVEFPPGHVSLSAVYVDAATGNRLVVSVFDEGGGELRLTYETEDRRDLVDGVCMGPGVLTGSNGRPFDDRNCGRQSKPMSASGARTSRSRPCPHRAHRFAERRLERGTETGGV